MRVFLARPDLDESDVEAVLGVLRSPSLALGPKMKDFEEACARYAGRRFGIAVNSGTSGLHLLVRAYGIGKGDEVITTPFSFIASSNAILYERARPVFVDVDERTGNIDPGLIETAITERTRAILPVDAFGQPAELDRVREIATRHGLKVIEDSCEAIGSSWKGVRAGNGKWSDGAVFAFYPNKQITTGEGGMIVTDDPQIAALCRSMRNQGRHEDVPGEETHEVDSFDDLWLNHERLGFNYRMDELSAALGLAQLSRIDELLAKRRRVADLYNQRLGSIDGVRLPWIHPDVTEMSWFVYVIQVGWEETTAEEQSRVRAHVMRALQEAGIQCRPYFTPIHLQPFYREAFGFKGGEFPVTERLGRTSIAIPFHTHLTEGEIDYVAATIEKALKDRPA